MTIEFTAVELAERAIYRRAVEAFLWGIPAVNFELLYQSLVRAKGAWNQVAYWSRLPTWKNQTLTPNPDVIYLFPFFNTQDVGPVVLEIPAAGDGSITGSVDDGWQVALEDVGPAGVDKGKGGKYLILPPGYNDKFPDGYIPMPSVTYAGYAILRSNLKSGSDADVAKGVAYGKRVRIYPLTQTANPPATTFVDVIDVLYDNIIPYDVRFFELLNSFVQREPWLERDKVMIDYLKSIGIEKGKAFQPDASTRSMLEEASREVSAWIDVKYEEVYATPYFSGTRWAVPAMPEVIEGMQTSFGKSDSYPVSDRGVLYSYIYFSAKHLGTGQFYVMTIKDKQGQSFESANTYRLNVPANPPVSLYWSATVYDRATHAYSRGQSRFSCSSLTPGLQKNADGSVDVYFGSQAPAGKESNWVPTNREGQFEVLFRFYGPQKALFDKTWKLSDIELAAAGDVKKVA